MTYRCHACGETLQTLFGSKMLYCLRCAAPRRVPTHPALISALGNSVDNTVGSVDE